MASTSSIDSKSPIKEGFFEADRMYHGKMDKELITNIEDRIDALHEKLESYDSDAQETQSIFLMPTVSMWTTGIIVVLIFIAIGLMWH